MLRIVDALPDHLDAGASWPWVSRTGRSRLIEHHALRPDGVADERVEVLLAKDDIDGTTERLLKLPVDCASREAEGTRGLDDEVDVRALRGVAARVAAEERHLVEAEYCT